MLLGDLIEDKKMVDINELENTITICFLNKKTESNIDRFNEEFDIVLTNEDSDFDTVEKIIKYV